MKNENNNSPVFLRFTLKPVAGFALPELLVVIAIVAIFTPVLYFTFARLLRSYTTENVKGNVQQTTRYAIEYMARDIRMAGFDSLGSSGTDIEEVSPTRIRFTADLNMNGAISSSVLDFERITYLYDPGNETLVQMRGAIPVLHPTIPAYLPEQRLVENVTALTFRYFDDSNPENEVIPDPTNPTDPAIIQAIKIVQVDMRVREDAGADAPVEREYVTRIRVRNLDL